MIDKNSFKLSIIIPCFNEKKTIQKIIQKIIESLKNYQIKNYEIIIVDDFSNDGTTDIIKNFKNENKIKVYFHESNLGKGAAIHTAIQHTSGEIIIIQDADLEYDPYDYNKLLLPFFENEYEV